MSDGSGTAQTTVSPPKRGRYPQTALALVGAIIGCLGIVAFLVLVVVRPDGATREPTDWHAAAEGAISAYGPEVLDPQLPEGWTANYARVAKDGDVILWEIGFLSPTDGYVGLAQALAQTSDAQFALPDELGESTGVIRIEGRDWTVFDRRAVDSTGNYAYGLATELPASLVLLHGSASDADFQVVAAAVSAQADR
ncbi:MAG TPA: DUF4245 domain-containing protein [Microbacteriaceae bacterium]|nr:DUF4245 domain-containing protein [Microbacteriaceae bacterium]